MDEWKERAMSYLACCAARRGAVKAYVIEAVYARKEIVLGNVGPQKGIRDQSTVTRHGSTRSVFHGVAASLTPLLPLTPSL
jgi:hypothetical protein